MLSENDLIKNAHKNRNKFISKMIDFVFVISIEVYTNHSSPAVIANLIKVGSESFIIEECVLVEFDQF